ncbi:glutathione S-transferase [Botrytis cinerea]
MLPITLYSHAQGPNPWKVAVILEELNIPYTTKFVSFSEVKKEPYTQLNPNGRLPSIEDPNTDITLWESGAIIEYLIEKYDVNHQLSYNTFAETYLAKQWLHFQASGQGPYYGQAIWFSELHPEKIQSAIDRFANEVRRVTGVLESVLKTREWLVGDKCTYADLCFIAWQRWAPRIGGEDIYKNYPHVETWMERMKMRPAVKKIYADQDFAITQAGKE